MLQIIIDMVGSVVLILIGAICIFMFLLWLLSFCERQWSRTCNFTYYLIYREEFKYWFKYERKKEDA